MTLTRFTPLHDVAVLQNRLNSIFNDFPRNGDATESLGNGSFVPAVDIHEDAHKLTLTLEIPGINPAEVDIRVENHTLTVRGERAFSADGKEENFHRIERRYGSFLRSFTLPSTVDTEQVNARSEHGVLTIELPKKAEAKPKQIRIAVNVNGSRQQPAMAESEQAGQHSAA